MEGTRESALHIVELERLQAEGEMTGEMHTLMLASRGCHAVMVAT